ncbi:hypothetical protein TeGR_g2673 [Tetraparma gracilis]|uniref:SsrA-binding protein n=1 Tax=Tetraparma gracilis TaxID=2962635 RepID=A0ABQ6N399_9STRA|nr:hypothetical protein TeGR_g2673 [Tetraparma gracilis]
MRASPNNPKPKAARAKLPFRRSVSVNKQARRNFLLSDFLEVGVALVSSEVKAARAGSVQVTDAYVQVRGGVATLHNCHFGRYRSGYTDSHEEKRVRRVLMHKSEARKLGAAVDRQGMTIVVTKVYFNEDNRLKMEVALAKGKNVRDKRQDIKARDLGRDVRRELKNWG